MTRGQGSTSTRRNVLRAGALVGVGALTGCIGAGATACRELTIGYQLYYAEAYVASFRLSSLYDDVMDQDIFCQSMVQENHSSVHPQLSR